MSAVGQWVRVAFCLSLCCGTIVGWLSAQVVDPIQRPPVMSLRETAAALARSGAAQNDARTVLAAAQIMITAERSSRGITRTTSLVRDSVRPGEDAKSGDLSAAALLRLASRIAVEQSDVSTAQIAAHLAGDSAAGLGDDTLATELGRAASAMASLRGATGGPIWSDGHLVGGDVVEYKIAFEGGYFPNRVNVSASNPYADLDCYLYQSERLVARDEDPSTPCSIEWNQQFTGTVVLRVRNTGASSYYVLISN